MEKYLRSEGAEKADVRLQDTGETPLFYAMKYIKSQLDRKLMVKTLIGLGADPTIKSNRGLIAHQGYMQEYGLDEASIYVEKAVHFQKNKKKLSELGEVFELKEVSKGNAQELKAQIFEKWEDFINNKPLEDRLKDDLEVALRKKQKIIDTFEQVQHSEHLDANSEFNDSDKIKMELRRKQVEIAARDILNSFQKYH